MGTITSQIDAIVAQRKDNIVRIEDAFKKLEPCIESVYKLEGFQDKLKSDPDAQKVFGGNQAMVEQILEISSASFREHYQVYCEELQRLKKRFERESLHISFIGSAGMGKSLVMQNISGLDGNIIPSARGGDCTGARSIITNYDIDGVNAEIEFYTEQELVEHVNKYLDVIFEGKEGRPRVRSISDLRYLKYDDIKAKLSSADSRASELLEHLKKYFEHIDEYAGDLGKKISVSRNDIEKYVAQYKSDDFSVKYFHYLGVKTANILCRFPYEDAGKIVLLDTIGIGTTSLGTEEQMFDTIRNDSDAIVWMFRPDSQRGRISATELDIMMKVQHQVSPEYTSNMMFTVINQVSSGAGENADFCPVLQEDMRKRNWPLADILTLDCSTEASVRDGLLQPILKQLSSKLISMDNLLIERANAEGKKLYDEYMKLNSIVEDALAMSSSEEFSAYLETSNKVEDIVQLKLTGDLRNRTRAYSDLAKQEYGVFKEECDKVLRKMIKAYPSKDMILRFARSGETTPRQVLELCANLTRYNVMELFLNLDKTLDLLVNNMKTDIIHILTDENEAKLGAILSYNDENPDEWLDDFEAILEKKNNYFLICSALSGFRKFSISVKGFIIPIVRYELSNEENGLDMQFRNQKTIPDIEASPFDEDLFVEEVQDILKNMLYDFKDGIEKKIEKYELYKMPYKALFAAVSDFYDRATFSANEDGDNRIKSDVRRQWRALYKDKNFRGKIWHKEYEEYCGTAEIAEEWTQIREGFANCNNLKNFVVD